MLIDLEWVWSKPDAKDFNEKMGWIEEHSLVAEHAEEHAIERVAGTLWDDESRQAPLPKDFPNPKLKTIGDYLDWRRTEVKKILKRREKWVEADKKKHGKKKGWGWLEHSWCPGSASKRARAGGVSEIYERVFKLESSRLHFGPVSLMKAFRERHEIWTGIRVPEDILPLVSLLDCHVRITNRACEIIGVEPPEFDLDVELTAMLKRH
jgi:hypothetical protein